MVSKIEVIEIRGAENVQEKNISKNDGMERNVRR